MSVLLVSMLVSISVITPTVHTTVAVDLATD